MHDEPFGIACFSSKDEPGGGAIRSGNDFNGLARQSLAVSADERRDESALDV
jgi:hypothetical protein